MKKLLFSTLIAASIPFLSLAQSSVLWQISENGLSAPSYLFGTLKFMGQKEYSLPREVVSKLKSTKVFAIEDQVDHHAQHELNQALDFPKGKSLSTELSKEEYHKVQSFFEKEFHVSKEKFDSKYGHIKPLALSIMMTRMSLGEKVIYPDIELLLLAKKNNIKTYSLESIEREAKALDAYPFINQKRSLMYSIDHFDDQKKDFAALMAAYPQGSLEEIFSYSVHPTENNPIFIEEFYYKRNQEWLPKLEKMMKENPSFISVGVSHLEGDQGLLALLKAKGYTLAPIPLKK